MSDYKDRLRRLQFNVERVLCAAIWFDDEVEHPHQPRNIKTGLVVCGWRHHNCYATAHALSVRMLPAARAGAANHEGFLTSTGRFVDRSEAGHIAFAADQVDRDNLCLMSEDLYVYGGAGADEIEVPHA